MSTIELYFFLAGELVVQVVLAVLVVSGVQHVDCVTFCTSCFIKGVIRERERKKKERERRKM